MAAEAKAPEAVLLVSQEKAQGSSLSLEEQGSADLSAALSLYMWRLRQKYRARLPLGVPAPIRSRLELPPQRLRQRRSRSPLDERCRAASHDPSEIVVSLLNGMACQYLLPRPHAGAAFSRRDAACLALALAVALSLACASGSGDRSTAPSRSAAMQGTPAATVEPISPTRQPPGSGIIEGSFRYPSSWIPPTLVACAERDDGETFCTAEHLYGPSYVSGQGYRHAVPVGSYRVYAVRPEGPGLGGAYYSEFVRCGFAPDCESHEPILVEVATGAALTGIDPGDWYAPSPRSPVPPTLTAE